MHLLSFLTVAGLASLVTSHGLVSKPATRTPGNSTAAACGKTMATFYQTDNTSYPEALFRANPRGLSDGYDPKKCNLWLCRGYQFGDNAKQVQLYKAGDTVDFEVFIRIPHKGFANVSIVDTTRNEVIGQPLKSWPSNYAASANPPQDQVKFSVKVPELAGRCAVPGVCVLQWYWLGQGQTYESCVDFTVQNAVPVPAIPIRGRSWFGSH